MPRYFPIQRIRQAIEHLSHYRSEWIIVPLVLAVNAVGEQDFVNPSAKGKAGTDKFLEQYFSGSLLGLNRKGNDSVRPRFQDVTTVLGDDISHQAVKLWGSHYSSRGYREMGKMGLLERQGPKYRVRPEFWGRWEGELAGFHFEELLVWLYAFKGFPDEIGGWEGLFVHFQEKHLGPGGRLPAQYARKFNVNNNVPWPNDLLAARPSDDEFQQALIPSALQEQESEEEAEEEIEPERDVETIIGSFDAALTTAGVAFGIAHSQIVRSFVVSVLAKPPARGKLKLRNVLVNGLAMRGICLFRFAPIGWGQMQCLVMRTCSTLLPIKAGWCRKCSNSFFERRKIKPIPTS
jgi:ribosomal protein L40E